MRMISGAARPTTSPRTSKAAGRTTVPHSAAPKRTTRRTKRTTRSRRALARRLGEAWLSLPVERAAAPVRLEIVTVHDPLAAAAFVEGSGRGLVPGAERGREDQDTEARAERTGDGAAWNQEYVGDNRTRLVDHLLAL